MDATEESLIEIMDRRAVKDAAILYERIRADGNDVSDPVKVRNL